MTGYHISSLLADLQDVIMGSTLVKCAAADLGIQWAGWALAAAFKTEKFYDLAGSMERLASISLRGFDLRPCADRFLFCITCKKNNY